MKPAATQTAPRAMRQFVRRVASRLIPAPWLLIQGPIPSRAVCLTFDDGPHPEWTPRVLDVLAAQRVPATFFLVGHRLAAHSDIARRMDREGHAIGHHSWYHFSPSSTGATQLVEEVQRSRQWLREHLGVDSRLFRPPHGRLSVGKVLRLWAIGQTVVLWNADPGDFGDPGSQRIVEWFDRYPLEAGDVVLLHDTSASTVAALPAIIARARARGLGFATVSEWARAGM
jgi:peptidoglycan/xylan/chitin deacetylase (PgdA/CDA1 family)